MAHSLEPLLIQNPAVCFLELFFGKSSRLLLVVPRACTAHFKCGSRLLLLSVLPLLSLFLPLSLLPHSLPLILAIYFLLLLTPRAFNNLLHVSATRFVILVLENAVRVLTDESEGKYRYRVIKGSESQLLKI